MSSCVMNGDIWVQSVINYFKNDESWSFKVNFKYDSTSDNDTASDVTKNPRWKLW